IIDDGGYCIDRVPPGALSRYGFQAVEQTTSGIARAARANFAVVSVASSIIKRTIEPHFIAEAVVNAISSAVLRADSPVGILGVGAIGAAVQKRFHFLGRPILMFDPSHYRGWQALFSRPSMLRSVFQDCGLILGCSGRDVSLKLRPNHLECQGEVFLASCSSGDVEFNSLLRQCNGG